MCTPVNSENVLAPVARSRALERNPHHREVRGAATDIGDQRDLLGVDALLIVEGGRDRLELEGDPLEAGGPGRRLELALRGGIGLGVVVDKERRTAKHHARRPRAEAFVGCGTQEAEKRRDDLAEGIALQLDLCGLLEKLGAENALDGAQIAAGLAREVALESVVAERRRIVVGAEEQRRRHRRYATLDGQQTRPRRVADANGGVRRPEIYAARKCHALLFFSLESFGCRRLMRRRPTIAAFVA